MEGHGAVLHDRAEIIEISGYDPDLDIIRISQINGESVVVGQEITLPSGARVTIYEGGYLEYVPRPSWVGIDQFTYRISDDISESQDAVFRIDVTNTVPVAHSATFHVSRENSTALQLMNCQPELDSSWGAYDPDGDQLVIQITRPPEHGRLLNYGGYLVYEPDTAENHWPGSDSFNYRVFDGIAASEEKEVWLHPDNSVAVPGVPQPRITAYRPLSNSNGMYKFTRMTPVPDGQKAYIRWNNDDDDSDNTPDHRDTDVKNEDDLIPIDLDYGINDPGNLLFRISKDNNNLRVWTQGPAKLSGPGGGQLLLSDSVHENVVPFLQAPNGAGIMRLWVEWIVAPDQAANQNETVISFWAVDKGTGQQIGNAAQIKFSGHESIVIVFGGYTQDPRRLHEFRHNYGTYILAEKLYRDDGYDVYAFRPDTSYVPARGELIDAIKNRGVQHAGIIGYSMGGGQTYRLAKEIKETIDSWTNPPPFTVQFTAYIDAVDYRGGASLYPPETRRPHSVYHLNIYQTFRGTHGLSPIGSPVIGSNKEINKTANGIDHYTIDDGADVISTTISELREQLLKR